MMDALPNIIPKSIIEVLNRLENDEDNRYSWKLTRNQGSLSLTVSCKLPAKTPNKAKDDSEVAERTTVKPVRRRRKKRNSPSALARSRRRHARFLEKKLAGKPDSPSPEDQQDPVCVKELENTSLVCGSDSDLESSDNPTPAPAVERVHDNSSKDTSSNTTISLQRQLVYYDMLSNATLSLLLFLPTTSGRKIS